MKSNYSNFWFDRQTSIVDDLLADDTDVQVKPKKNYIQLAAHQRAIGNFVRIVGGKDIPVKFASRGDSYTDGETVTIGSKVSEKNFDQTVGLALHEGSHIAFSDFRLLQSAMHADWIESYGHVYREFFKSMINYVEDRRIDTIVFKSSPGYKGYYHTLYSKYFNHKTISMGLASAEYREVDFDSYLFRIINFTNSETDLSALPLLDKIYNTIDLKNVSRLENTAGAIEVARNICEIVFPLIASSESKEQGDGEESQDQNGETQESQSQGGGQGQDQDDQETSDNQESKGVTPNSDDTMSPSSSSNPNPQPLNQKQQQRLDNLIQKEMDLLKGKTPKSKMSKQDQKIVDSVANSGATLEEAGDARIGNTKVVVIPRFTQELVDNGAFHFTNSWAYGREQRMGVINEGLRLGTLLGKKLKVRGEERELIFTRQRSGKINKRLISELGFGNADVFSQTRIERYNKASLHLSIDGSGSMNGTKFDKAITSVVAICKAAQMAGNIKVVVSFRYTQDDQPVVLIAYDSTKDKIQKIKTLWPHLQTCGTTPESLCYDAMMNNILQTSASDDNYFINYSDGAPWFSNSDAYYHGDRAADHCKRQVKMMKNRGVKILSYFISNYSVYESDRKIFKSMYGDDASFINPSNMMEVAKTMNGMFLTK